MSKQVNLAPDWEQPKHTQRDAYWESSADTPEMKLSAFAKYTDRSELSRFMVKHEIFKRIANVQGSIIECGVHFGGGLFSWAQMSAIYEPLNHRRRIIGFDTFSGFAAISEKDAPEKNIHSKIGGYKGGSYEDIQKGIELFDVNRPLASIPKIEVIPGDFMKTSQAYLEQNPHLVVSLLYLDFDVYEPTKKALELFLPRMPKGAIVAFDELHCEEWAGETVALHEVVGIHNARIERMPFVDQLVADRLGTASRQ